MYRYPRIGAQRKAGEQQTTDDAEALKKREPVLAKPLKKSH
jgi:hypothetical protein